MARVVENNKYAPGNATKLTNLVKHIINLCKNCIFGGHAAGFQVRFPVLFSPPPPPYHAATCCAPPRRRAAAAARCLCPRPSAVVVGQRPLRCGWRWSTNPPSGWGAVGSPVTPGSSFLGPKTGRIKNVGKIWEKCGKIGQKHCQTIGENSSLTSIQGFPGITPWR